MRATIPWAVRWLIRRDMPDVLRIEQASFPRPWSEAAFLDAMCRRNCIGVAAEPPGEDRVLGYMLYELHRSSLHILNLAVDPGCRRRGVGSALAGYLDRKLSAHRRNRVSVNVRESDLPAQLFFRSAGFEAVRVERGLYEDAGEDGYRMVHRRRPRPGETLIDLCDGDEHARLSD